MWENNKWVPFEKLPLNLFRSIICSPELLEKASHNRISYTVCRYFMAKPSSLNASILHEMTRNLDEVETKASTPENFRNLIIQLDPSDGGDDDEESWKGLNRLCDMCSDVIVREGSENEGWLSMERGCFMNYFLNPCIEGDYRGSGRLAICMLESALERAKEVHTSQQNEINALKSEISRLQRYLQR